MNILILSRNPKCYSTTRLREAAESHGHGVDVLDTLRFAIAVEEQDPDLVFRNKELKNYDAVIPRIGASITQFGTAVVRQFEQMGTFALNSSHAISISRDKLRSLQVLSRHDIGLPNTAFVRDKHDVLPAIERVGGVPVIIKLLEGTQGIGVILADRVSVAAAIIETLQSTRQNVLIQKFVAESKGKDIRAFVVGGEVVAAMRRRAQGQEFRSNVHRGGSTEVVELDEEYKRTAVRAAQIMGLRVAGVDMLEGEDGPKVLEVNSSPGLEGIETATRIDVAGAVIDHTEHMVDFPEIDLRQRLALHAGYGIAEFQVIPDSSLANQTLADTNLRDRDVLLLDIERNGVHIPSPHGSQELLPGDNLLCFGKMITIRSLFPPNHLEQKKAKKKKQKKQSKAE